MSKILEDLAKITNERMFKLAKNIVVMNEPSEVKFERYPEGIFYRSYTDKGLERFGFITDVRVYTIKILK